MSFSKLTPRKDSARSISSVSSRSISIRSAKSSTVNSPRVQKKNENVDNWQEAEVRERSMSKLGEDKLAFEKSPQTPLAETSKDNDKKEEKSNEIIKSETEIDQSQAEEPTTSKITEEEEKKIKESILEDIKDLGLKSINSGDIESKGDNEKSETTEFLTAVAQANKITDNLEQKSETLESSDEDKTDCEDKIEEERENEQEKLSSDTSEETPDNKKSLEKKSQENDKSPKKIPTKHTRKYPSNRGKKVLRTVVTLMSLTRKKQPKLYRTKNSDGSYSDSYKSYKMHKFKENKSLSSDLYMSKLLLENTYKMSPDIIFPQLKIEKLIYSVLEDNLRTMRYVGENMGRVTKMLTDVLRERAKSIRLERYKLITWVVISQKDKGDIRIVSRGLLDQKTDNYATSVYENSSLICVASVFGIYLD